MIRYTTFTSTSPARLTKVYGLDAEGRLTKAIAANMAAGRAVRTEARDLHELGTQLAALTPAQAVSWGIAERPDLTITCADREEPDIGALARTRSNFAFSRGPGILMLDHDGMPDAPLDRDELRARLIGAVPELQDAPMLWRPSASAGLVAPDGRVLTGLHRHRLYVPVSDASLIPEAGKRLLARLEAVGLGWFEVGQAGQALRRCIVDASVWQPERLDFAAAPILSDGITRPAEDCVVYGDATALFDLKTIEADDATRKTAAKRMAAARDAVADRCRTRRASWASERAPGLASARGITVEKAQAVLTRASEHCILMGHFELVAQDGRRVSVADVLDDPDRWNNCRFSDPLGSYPEDRRVAFVNLRSGGRPYLWSHGHGGMRFELVRQSARIQVGKGLRIATTDSVLQVLRDRGELYEFGEGAVAYVTGARARLVGPDWLTDHLGRACEFYSVKRQQTGEDVEVAEDAPSGVARAVLAKHGERGFRQLVAVVTAPTLRPDGSVLDKPGHDAESGLLYYSESPTPPTVPDAPTPADALAALKVLWAPLRKFPLVDDVARGVVLHGLLTASIRAALPTAPGIALDAPAAGTGKTLLARCIGILTTGEDPAVLPPADTDEETRKRLFAALREGSRTVLWDNVREPLGCAALDSFLTAPIFKDRVLGESSTQALPNRALFIATGNNLRLTGDTCRRVFLARLDAESEQPYARDFAFDPAQRVASDRLQLVVAALTIIRAYIAAGRPKVASGRTASFEAWDDLVRQPLCWLAELVRKSQDRDLPPLADPLQAAQRAFDGDPETTKHTALLHAWWAEFEDRQTTVAAAVRRGDTSATLQAALEEIGGQGARINTRIVGRWIERHVGRRIGGLRFERGTMAGGLTTWRARRDAAVTSNKPTSPTKPTNEAAPPSAPGPAPGGFGGIGGSVSGQAAHGGAQDAADSEVF